MRRTFTLAAVLLASAAIAKDPPAISWKKTTLDPKFRAEGVAVADVNKDGKIDVLIGEFWYEAPDWTRHEMQKPGEYGNGLGNYSKVFCCWPEDLNGDGYPDLIVVDFPGAPCYWLENPKGKTGTHWTKHPIWHSACNETPQYLDLFGTGKRVLLMAFQPKGAKADGNAGQMAYFTPNPKDPTAEWEMHPVSEPSGSKPVPGTNRFSHGLGAGDVNGDKRLDVITVGGWWEQPEKADGKTAWAFHPNQLTDAAADIYALDMDGDGKADLLSTSAHKFGIWWHKQRPAGKDGHPTFEKQVLFKDLVSETHAAHLVDIDGDGVKDLVTGKRWWSHGRSEPGSDWPARVHWLKAAKAADGLVTFTPQTIDEDSGVGTQFVVQDVNGDGLLDVVTSNKKGVHLIVQARK